MQGSGPRATGGSFTTLLLLLLLRLFVPSPLSHPLRCVGGKIRFKSVVRFGGQVGWFRVCFAAILLLAKLVHQLVSGSLRWPIP